MKAKIYAALEAITGALFIVGIFVLVWVMG